MAFELTVGGYTFENPPESYRKRIELGNSEQQAQNRTSSSFYQSDSQEITLEVEGSLALNPALGGTDDTNELEKLQDLGISGGEVEVEFDPFFSGMAVIEDDPFEQEGGESSYKFTFTINSESTDASAYPAHSAPDTGNTFEFGDLNLGFDPNKVTQNYKRNTQQTKRLQGIARSVDTKGLVPEVRVTGIIDGDGQAQLWDKARSNVLAYLNAEFQNGWALIDRLSIQNLQDAPDYLNGMFRYDMQAMVVMDPSRGIGEVSKFVDRQVQDLDEYVSNCDDDGLFERLGYDAEGYPDSLDYRVTEGTGSLQGDYVQWDEHFGTLDQNATNYLFVEDSDGDGYGQVNRNTSGFPATSVPLWEVDTTSDSVTDIRDRRSCLMGERLDTEETGDINLSSGMRVKDSIDFERLLRISDSMAITDPTFPWLGLATLSESLAVADGPLDVQGIADLTESLSVLDGGTATDPGSSTSTETTDWGTASDWDAFSSQENVQHYSEEALSGGTIRLGVDDRDPFGNNGLVGMWPLLEGSGTEATDVSGNGNHGTYNGNVPDLRSGRFLGRGVNDFDGSGDYVDLPNLGFSGAESISIIVWHYTRSGTKNNWFGFGSAGTSDAVCTFRSNDDGGYNFYFWGNDLQVSGGTAPSYYGSWTLSIAVYDQPNSNRFIYQDGAGQIDSDSPTDPNWDNTSYSISNFNGENVDGQIALVGVLDYPLSVSQCDTLADILNGSITTGFQSFSDDADPASLQLKNVDATLNSQNVDVVVESDVDGDGVADETSDTITLDGSGGPYDVTGLSSSSQHFRLVVQPSSTDITASPEFGAATLEGQVGGGGDADQNPNTEWIILGATHDTSGNEYEGGGVVSKYDG